ncbi:MAG TPA: N-acetylmuramoyl-L-alanine amidase [Clostridia bacterium]|nr:N-acetylmuramoyl-L-alanine amidase [Clostridia bacterium]
MILVVKKQNIALILLIFLLSLTILSFNIGRGDDSTAVTGNGAQRTIIIDPGHGGEDPGKVGNTSGIKEKDLNLEIANKVKVLLEKENYKVIMTRTEDKLEYDPETRNIVQKRVQDLTRRKGIMDTSGADIVVSIHQNGLEQTQYWGSQTFFPHNSTDSQRLAVSIQNALKEIADPNNKRAALVRGRPDEQPIIILRNLKTPTVIVECGFLSNEGDEKRLATAEYQDKLAESIKTGIMSYFNGSQK